MLGLDYTTYEEALEICYLETLSDRRKKLCKDFAINLAKKNTLCNEWLPVAQSTCYSLRKRPKNHQLQCKTKRFQNSALPLPNQLT